MEFMFSADQDQFRDMVARFCRDKSPTTIVRDLMATQSGFDRQVWSQMSKDLGLLGLHIPEEHGGAGFSAVELGIVMEEFGRSLFGAPYLSSCVLTTTCISAYGHETQRNDWLPTLLDGSRIGALAVSEQTQGLFHSTYETTATASEGGYSLNGTKRYVIDGQNADLLVVAASVDGDSGLFVIDSTSPGVNTTPVAAMDPTRKLAQIDFDNAQCQLLGAVGVNTEPLFDLAAIALANEMVGGAQALLDAAVEYTKLRVQFGRPVGSFQAIKHRLADLLIEVEMAKSAAYQAAQAYANGERVSEYASLAKAAASEAYLQAGITCIQLHGGIGFTWENDTHLWFKRAKSSEVLFGSPHFHRERMLAALEKETQASAA